MAIWTREAQIPQHGGSLQLYICHNSSQREQEPSVNNILKIEKEAKMFELDTYLQQQEKVLSKKFQILSFLIDEKNKGKQFSAFGAAAKATTLFNYCNIDQDLIKFCCDNSTSKQKKLIPGCRIPILDPSWLKTQQFDYVFVIPWNIKQEIKAEIIKICGYKPSMFCVFPNFHFL